jgi:hypothetical protein
MSYLGVVPSVDRDERELQAGRGHARRHGSGRRVRRPLGARPPRSRPSRRTPRSSAAGASSSAMSASWAARRASTSCSRQRVTSSWMRVARMCTACSPAQGRGFHACVTGPGSSTCRRTSKYMAVGKPVVQVRPSRRAGVSRGRFLYVTHNDAEALGEGIATLLDDPEARAPGWARSARSASRRWSTGTRRCRSCLRPPEGARGACARL